MHTINKNQVSMVEGGRQLATEASTIGLAPGEWPDFIAVVDDAGEGFLFMSPRRIDEAVEYSTKDRRFGLVVFND